MALASRLRHSATIERRTQGARNDYGIKAETFASIGTVRCWYQPASRREMVEDGEGGAIRIDGKVFMLPTDLRESDRLVIGGTTYSIIDVHDAAGKGHHLEVMVKRAEVPDA